MEQDTQEPLSVSAQLGEDTIHSFLEYSKGNPLAGVELPGGLQLSFEDVVRLTIEKRIQTDEDAGEFMGDLIQKYPFPPSWEVFSTLEPKDWLSFVHGFATRVITDHLETTRPEILVAEDRWLGREPET